MLILADTSHIQAIDVLMGVCVFFLAVIFLTLKSFIAEWHRDKDQTKETINRFTRVYINQELRTKALEEIISKFPKQSKP